MIVKSQGQTKGLQFMSVGHSWIRLAYKSGPREIPAFKGASLL